MDLLQVVCECYAERVKVILHLYAMNRTTSSDQSHKRTGSWKVTAPAKETGKENACATAHSSSGLINRWKRSVSI